MARTEIPRWIGSSLVWSLCHAKKCGNLSFEITIIVSMLVWNFIFGHQRVLGMVDRLAFLKDLSGCVSRMYWRERKWRLEDKLGSS